MDPDAAAPIPATAGPSATRPASPRVRIAQLAARAATAVPGVVDLQTGPLGLRMTGGAGRRIDGVVVAALADGRYEVDLHLVCGLVALPPLADRVRTAVFEAAVAAGVGEAVGTVHVRIEDISHS